MIWPFQWLNIIIKLKTFWYYLHVPETSGKPLYQGRTMRKQRIEYDSPVDALVAIAKRLSIYEGQYQMTSEDFFDKYSKGKSEDSEDFVEWANDYQHYIVIRREIEGHLQHVAWLLVTIPYCFAIINHQSIIPMSCRPVSFKKKENVSRMKVYPVKCRAYLTGIWPRCFSVQPWISS